MSEFLFDKAKMALKSQRYDEASSAYEKILETSYNVEAWTGLGVCKMFQIADGRSMQEVLYCFEKARQVEGANNLEIDLKLIQYAQIVILQCSAFAVTSIQNALEAEKNAKTASLISLVSVGLAAVSNSTGVKILAGAAAATAAGVAVGQFGKMTSSKEIAKYAVNLLENIYNNVFTFLIEKDRTNEAKVLKETTEQLINHILDVLDVTRAQERILMENLEKEGKALDEYNEKVVASLTDEELISLASSFADLGFITKADTLISPLSFLSFDNLSDSNILKLVNNDTILFSLKSFSGTHYFCKNGILSYTKIYYPYLSIKSLEKNWIGGIKDKQSGYLLDLAMGGPDWQSIVINFINIKKKTHDQNPELPMASTSEKIMIKAINPVSATSINDLPLLPFVGKFKEIVENNCKEDDNFKNVLIGISSSEVFVFGEKGVIKYTSGFGVVNLKYYKYNDILDLQKYWLGGLKDKSSGFAIWLPKGPENWIDIIKDFIEAKKT